MGESPRLVPVFLLAGFCDELERRGVSPSALERLSGVARPRVGDLSSGVPESAVHRLFEAGQQLTGDAALGLSVGQAMGMASFDLVGHLALASASLEQALELVSRVYTRLPLRLPVLEPCADGRMRFGGPQAPTSPGARIQAELTAALLYGVVLHFLDPRFGSPAVELPFAAPADLEPYRRIFAGALSFDGEGTYCSFPREALVARRSGADSELPRHLLALAQQRFSLPSAGEDWTSRVKRVLHAQAAPRLVDARALATQLGVSPRGLSRRLARENATLSELIEHATYERARALLSRPGATAVAVAEELGYLDGSSFFRAFKRWSGGVTPSLYAQREKAE